MQEHTDDICKALRTWRIRSRLQQATIAECLGVTQSQISRWESGRDTPRPHNVEAIRRLVWGAEAEPLQALKHFVQNSTQLLMLIDAENGIIARSEPLRHSPNLMDRFGWVLDPETNPAFAPAWRRFSAILSQPDGVVGMTVTCPLPRTASTGALRSGTRSIPLPDFESASQNPASTPAGAPEKSASRKCVSAWMRKSVAN
jgi:transcriptional regulator with XRE-family HTH domain